MKHLIVLILAAITIMTLMCGGIIAIRRMIPHNDTELVPGLETCGETSCYWGVAFDETSLDEARKTWTSSPLEAIESNPNHYWSEKYKTAFLLLPGVNGVAGGVITGGGDYKLLVGDVIQHLGSPCSMVSVGGTLIITYQSMQFFSSGNRSGNSWTLSPTALVADIHLLGSHQKNCSLANNKTVLAWHGFGQYR